MFISGVPEKIVAEVTGHESLKLLRQYERTTNQQFQVVGQSISTMQGFKHELSKSEVKNEKLSNSEMKNEDHKLENSERTCAVAREIQKVLPSISSNLNNCTFNFN